MKDFRAVVLIKEGGAPVKDLIDNLICWFTTTSNFSLFLTPFVTVKTSPKNGINLSSITRDFKKPITWSSKAVPAFLDIFFIFWHY